ncbi:Variable surface protein Vir7-like protein [Plasmodium coatneyi]|uniref:Variable surface protein Vir7-like protein n=1 Tax=Plasmodium coatneyi TaxID=208452 RepID=A0A1B1DT58_9APIC|nr:Variable surface protein Vir7-like protein [Plasmodium coatneyi]ANQ05960.1 Variable surface protein Vir7-like protein [Plasmodium coatneyi]
MTTVEEILGGLNLDNLPSRLFFYGLFEGSTGTYEDECARNIKGILSKVSGAEGPDDKIMKGVYYVSEKYGKHEWFNADRCTPLYYWIGDKLSQSSRYGSSFPDIMSLICEELRNSYAAHGCRITCSTIGRNIMGSRKVIYDYPLDNGTIQGQLLIDESLCNEKYRSYVQVIAAAYNIISNDCTTNVDEYCKNFKGQYGENSHWEVSKSDCKLTKTSKPVTSMDVQVSLEGQGPKGTISSPENSNNITTTVISSILPITIGLPFAAFMLYKVQL